MSRRHKITWSELKWSVKCTCSWGHLSNSRKIAEAAVENHLKEAAELAARRKAGA